MALTRDEAQGVARLFIRDYPGALELAYNFRDNTAELYGPRAGEVPPDMKGGYIPQQTAHAGRTYRGRVEVPLENMTDVRDLLVTLRHEVLGHYGANTFAPSEKRALLDALIAAREEPSVKPLWADIDDRYAGKSLDMRAEEVYALHCEGVAPSQHVGTDQPRRGQQAFQETCLAPVRLMCVDDLQSIACMVAQGLRDRTRTQQNFPTTGELFRRKDDDMEVKKPFHEAVAAKLIEQLKAGTAPWQKPWRPGEPGAMLPINPTTGKRYKGINAIHLLSQGRDDQRWMTYKQAVAAGAQVRKGEHATPIQYWKFDDERIKTDAAGKPILDGRGEPVKQTLKLERPRVFFASVFNAEQIDGLPAPQPRPAADWTPLERAERVLQASGARIEHIEGDRAYYRPATDSIHLPLQSQFAQPDGYYATALHELGHWTGHESRLARDLAHPFGSQEYAKEELRAEIASMILGDELGIGHDPGQHAAYVGSWIKTLQDDPLEIFRAAADAEKIHGFVLGLEQQQQQQASQQSQAAPQSDLVAELQALHATAEHGYSPLESWANLDATARQLGLTAAIERGGDLPYDPLYGIAYTAEDGQPTPIRTALSGDGRALTTLGGADAQRAEPTANPQLQSLALTSAAADLTLEAHMNQPRPDDFPGNLVQRLTASGTMSLPDAEATRALRDLRVAAEHIATPDPQPLAEASLRALGAPLPPDWTGEVQIVGVIERFGALQLAAEIGETPTAFFVLANRAGAPAADPTLLATLATADAAQDLADRLALIDAYSQTKPYQEDLRLAALREQQVRRAPDSTAVQVAAARELRKDAQFLATRHDPDLEERAGRLPHRQQPGGQPGVGEAHPVVVWTGRCTPDIGGFYETRPTVARSAAGFVPALEVSRFGGAWEPAYATPVATLEDAIGAAHRMEADWHGLETQDPIARTPPTPEPSAQVPAEISAASAHAAAAVAPTGAYQAELAHLLALSTLTPGSYVPSVQVRAAHHAAVLVDGAPAILCGPSDEPASIAHAAALCNSAHVVAGLRAAGLNGEITVGEVAGSQVLWQDSEAAVVAKPSGQVEPGGEQGPLVAIVLNDPEKALATILCVTTETARIFDANAPELDDGRTLHALARGEPVPARLGRTYLDVPFAEKDEAKAFGARWDRGEQAWYIPPGVEAAPFVKWEPGASRALPAPSDSLPATQASSERQTPRQGRVYLAVPFGEHAVAKAAGAKWDKAAKSWYAGPKADLTKLQRWSADNAVLQQAPAQTPHAEFADALRSLGCVVEGDHPIMDGTKHRIPTVGDKRSERSGFYVGHLDGHPAGYIKNNRSGLDMNWKAKGYTLDPAQKAQMQAEAAQKLQARQAEQARLHEQAALRLARQLTGLAPVTQPTPYMQAKRIQPHVGAFTDKDGQTTYLPAIDTNGKHWTTQYIQPDGTKRFAKDSRKEGCFHPVGGLDALAKAPALVIAEGYATAASLSESLGFATVAAFDSGNLVEASIALAKRFPDKPIIIAGDDDKHVQATLGVNPGRSKATEASQSIGGSRVLFPIFAPGEQESKPKGFTDFNDLATKSALGRDGLDRQVRPIVEAVIAQHQAAAVTQQQDPVNHTAGRFHESVRQSRRSASLG